MAKGKAKEIPSIGLGISIDHTDLDKGLKQTGKKVEDFGKSPAFGMGAAGFFGIGVAAAGATAAIDFLKAGATTAFDVLTSMAAAGFENATALSRQAVAIDISTEALDGWQYAASLVGAETDAVADSMLAFQQALGDSVREGAGPVSEVFEKLGWSVEEFANLKPDEQFLKLADALSEMDSASATSVIGALGMDPKTVALWRQGAEGIKAARDEAKALGLVLTDDQTKGIDLASKEVGKLHEAWASISDQFAAAVAPAVHTAATAILGLVKNVGNWQAFMEAFVDQLIYGASWVVEIGAKIVAYYGYVGSIWTNLGREMLVVVGAVAEGWDAVFGTKLAESVHAAEDFLADTTDFLANSAADNWSGRGEQFLGWAKDGMSSFKGLVGEAENLNEVIAANPADDEARKYLESLQKQLDLTTTTQEQWDLNRLAMEGANDAVLDQIKNTQKLLDTEKERLKVEEEVKSKKATYFDLLKTDLDKQQEAIEEFRKFANANQLFDGSQRARIEARLRGSGSGSARDPIVRAAEQGSSAASEIMAKFRYGLSPDEKLVKNTEMQWKEQKETNRLLATMNNGLLGGDNLYSPGPELAL